MKLLLITSFIATALGAMASRFDDSPCRSSEVNLCCEELLTGETATNFLDNNGLDGSLLAPGSGIGIQCCDFGSPRLPCDKEKERDSCCDKREDHRLADGYVIVGCAEATPVEEAWGYEL